MSGIFKFLSFKLFFLSCFFILFPFTSNAVVKGSETVVSIEPFFTFPAADNDNAMLGFGWFKNGFALEDNTTTCTFDSVYPVSGNVDFNGGVLYLAQDLEFQNGTIFLDLGHVYGQGYAIEMCSSVTSLVATYTLYDTSVDLSCDVEIGGHVTIDGDCTLRGNGYHMKFLDDSTILIGSNSTYVLENVELRDLKNGSFVFTDDSSKLVLSHVDWYQSGDFTFDTGSILFRHEVNFAGAHNFYYESSRTSTLGADTRWMIADGMTLHIGRSESEAAIEPLYFVDDTSILAMDTCSFVVTEHGIGLTKGKFELERDVFIDVTSSTTTDGLILGTGQEADDFSMILNSGAAVHVNSGCWVYNNYNNTGKLHALSEASRCFRYADSKFYVMTDWTIPPMMFKVASGNPASILCDGVSFRYDQTMLANSMAEFEITGQELSPGFRLAGDDYIYMTKGSLPLPVYISGTNNKLHGTGEIAASVILEDLNASVCCSLSGAFSEDIILNGGEFILLKDLDLEPDTIFSGSGTVSIGKHRIDFGSTDDEWDSEIEWSGVGGSLELQANTDLSGTWTFDGSCVVAGNGHVLNIISGGKIVVTEGSNLTLRNIIIQGISDGDIQCLSDESCLILDNVSWIQDEHVTFDTGSILFSNSVDFNGSYSFVYDSSQTSTVDAHSRWLITDSMTLQIGRKDSFDDREPLYFSDESSKLRLKKCSFVPTASGMSLTKGTVEVQGDVSIDGLSTSTLGSFMFGSGQEDEDVVLKLDSGASIKFNSGWLAFNNVNPNTFLAASDTAQFIRYGPSKLHLMKSVNLPPMLFQIHSGLPETLMDDGAEFSYDNTHIVFPTVEYDFSGNLIGFAHFALNGGHTLYLTKGLYLPYLSVSNGSNYMMGTGDIGGLIMLQGPTAELICSLNGTVLQSPMMNGGKITLSNDLHLGPDVHLSGEGRVDLSSYQCLYGPTDTICTDTTEWDGDGGGIKLGANIDLSGTWTFKDDCVLNGQGHALSLELGGRLVVDDGAELVLKDLMINGIADGSIVLLSDESRLVFDNVYWSQDDTFTFSTGSMKFVNRVDFQGESDFVYDSACTSTIEDNATWVIRDGLILKIGRKESYTSAEPLYLADPSSALKLKNCSFVVTSSGFNLKGGKLFVDGDVSIDGLMTSTEGSFMFGSGQEGEDVEVNLESGASIKFKTGWLAFNNADPDTFLPASDTAQFIRYADSKLHIMQNLNFPNMIFKVFSGFPQTLIDDGISLSYANTHMVFPTVEFDLTGGLIGFAHFSLTGGKSLYMTKGSFLPYLSVMNSANYLVGTGDITGLIMLQDSNAELICNLNGSILQSIMMNGGKITLSNDLYLGPNVHFAGEGAVDLSFYQVVFGAADMICTDTIEWDGDGGGIKLRANLDFSGTWTFKDSCVFNGQGHTLDLSSGGKFVVDEGSSLILKNIVIGGVSSGSITCLDDDASIILDDVSWAQDGDYTFSVGSLKILNGVEFRGAHQFFYDSSQTSSVMQNATWRFTDGIELKIGRKESCTGTEPLYFANQTSVLNVEDCSFVTTASGLALTRGKIDLNGTVMVDSFSTTTNGGLMIGDGTAEGDMEFHFESGASVQLTSGWLLYNNVSPTAATASSATARAIRHADSNVYVMQSWVFPSIVVQVTSGLPATLMAPGAAMMYDSAYIKLAGAEFELTGAQLSPGLYALSNGGSLYLTKGNLPLYLYISGAANSLFGTGDVSGVITFADSNAELVYSLNGFVLTSPVLNGGKLSLAGNLRLGPNVCLNGPGEVDLSGYRCCLGLSDYIWTGTVAWDGDGGSIELGSEVSLHATWTFKNECVLEGNGNLLKLDDLGNIVVDDGATLTLRDITVEGVSGNQIRCLSNDSTIILDNVSWIQDGNYTFTTGSMQWKHDVRIGGKYLFDYQTTQTSTILQQSNLRLDSGLTFTYNPMGSTSRELLAFADDTSKLTLKGATLAASSVGLYLTKGNFVVKGLSYLDCEVDLLSDILELDDGIVFGDGTAENDIALEISPGGNLNLIQGSVAYRNVLGGSADLVNYLSTLKLSPDTRFVVVENLNLGVGKMEQSKQAFVHVMDGKKLTGAVFMAE